MLASSQSVNKSRNPASTLRINANTSEKTEEREHFYLASVATAIWIAAGRFWATGVLT